MQYFNNAAVKAATEVHSTGAAAASAAPHTDATAAAAANSLNDLDSSLRIKIHHRPHAGIFLPSIIAPDFIEEADIDWDKNDFRDHADICNQIKEWIILLEKEIQESNWPVTKSRWVVKGGTSTRSLGIFTFETSELDEPDVFVSKLCKLCFPFDETENSVCSLHSAECLLDCKGQLD